MKNAIKALFCVAVFAASGFSQGTAYVPVKVNVGATVSIQPSSSALGTGDEKIVTANQQETLVLQLSGGSSPIFMPQQAKTPVVSFSRGRVSLELHQQMFRNADISLFSINGKQILRGKSSMSANVAEGVYLLSVNGAGGNFFTTKLAHGGGELNINVAFGGEALSGAVKKAAGDYGAWTIKATADGYLEKSYLIYPDVGENALENITLEQRLPNCTQISANNNITASAGDCLSYNCTGIFEMKNSGNSNRTASSITGGCNKSSVNIPGGNAWTTICENSSGELQIVVGTGSAWNNNIQVRCTAPSSSSSGNGGSSSSGTAEPPPSQNFTENLNGLSSSRKPLDMVYVQGGTYIRGCTDGDSRCSNSYSGYANEIPRHNVTLSDFLVAKYELTNAQWNAVMGSSGGDDTPKTNITWYDAIDFTCEIGKKTGKKYRLLTDAEFEFAARGGTQTSGYYWSGSNTACDVAQVEGCVSGSGFGGHAVGGKSSNELGLYDMSGNVYEWVFDNWGGGTYTDYSGVSSSGGNLTNPVIEHYHGQKTRRGGSYDQLSEDSRVSARKIRSIEGADGSIGLRLALSADGSYPVGMTNPCDIHAPEIVGTKKGYRDERLITASGQTWEGTTGMDASKMVLLSNGAAAAAGYLLGTGSYGMNNMTGEWYTINNYILHIVSSSGTVKRYMYYMVDNNNMSLMAEGGMPWRFQKKTGTGPSTSGVTVSDRTPEALAQQYSPNGYNINMNSPPTSGRDQRVIEGPNYAWVQDNVAMGAGGTHRYRKDFDDANNMRFVVWDKGQYTGLARGSWFTIDNAFLRVTYTSGSTTKVFDYLYTVSEDENTFYHISFQGYEPGDYRMFTKEPISNEASFGWTNAPSTFSYPYDNREDGTSTYIPPSD